MLWVMKLAVANKFQARSGSPCILIAQLCCAFFLLLFMGKEAFAGYQPDLMVRLATEGDSSYVGEGIFESSALSQTKSQAAYPGSPAQFRLLLKNAGDLPDSFTITGPGSDSGFTVSYLDRGGVDRVASLSGAGYLSETLAPGASMVLLVQVTPTVLTLGASYRVAVSAVSANDPAGRDQVKTETVACGPAAAVTVSAPPDGSGSPGATVNYPYIVTNVGNAADSFTLALDGTPGWQGSIFADDGAGGGVAGDGARQGGENSIGISTGSLAPGGAFHLFVAVTVPESGADGARGDARLTVTGEGAGGADQVTTSAIAATISLVENVRNLTRGGAFATTASALPGDLLQYRMAITNSGSASATSVSIDNALPAGVDYIPDTLSITLAPESDAESCAAVQCGWARAAAGSIIAHLGQGATDAAGGALLPGGTLYLFFRAQVQ